MRNTISEATSLPYPPTLEISFHLKMRSPPRTLLSKVESQISLNFFHNLGQICVLKGFPTAYTYTQVFNCLSSPIHKRLPSSVPSAFIVNFQGGVGYCCIFFASQGC